MTFEVLPPFWQHDVLNTVSLFEEWRNLLVRKSCYATTNAGDKERQVLMLLGELYELIDVRTDADQPERIEE